MTRASWLSTLALAVACSSRDETLGETRQTPDPIVLPEPGPEPAPDPNPQPCEDTSKRLPPGKCVPMGKCLGHVLTVAGYECESGSVCCDTAPGCGRNGCGSGGTAGSGASQAGRGG
jgi:hypothetical protein